jgi:hypothetical protein
MKRIGTLCTRYNNKYFAKPFRISFLCIRGGRVNGDRIYRRLCAIFWLIKQVLVKTKKCSRDSSVDSKKFCQSLLRPLFYKIYTVSFPYDNNSMAYYKNIVNIWTRARTETYVWNENIAPEPRENIKNANISNHTVIRFRCLISWLVCYYKNMHFTMFV